MLRSEPVIIGKLRQIKKYAMMLPVTKEDFVSCLHIPNRCSASYSARWRQRLIVESRRSRGSVTVELLRGGVSRAACEEIWL